MPDATGGIPICSSLETDEKDKKQRREARRKMVKKCETSSPYSSLLVILKYCGLLFYLPKRTVCGFHVSSTVIYHSVILIATWVNVFRFFQAYSSGEPFGPQLVSKIMLHAFFIKSSLCVTSCTFLSLKRDRMWNIKSRYYDTFGLDVNRSSHMTRRVNIALGISLFTVSATTGYYIVMAVTDRDWLLERLYFRTQDPTLKIVAAVFACVQALTTSAAWVLPICMLVLLCLDIRDSFRKFTFDLYREVKAKAVFDLEYFRQRHQGLCGIVRELDNIHAVFTLNVYATNIPIICILIYVAILGRAEPAEMATMLTENFSLFLGCLGEIIVVTAAGTALSAAVRSFINLLPNLTICKIISYYRRNHQRFPHVVFNAHPYSYTSRHFHAKVCCIQWSLRDNSALVNGSCRLVNFTSRTKINDRIARSLPCRLYNSASI